MNRFYKINIPYDEMNGTQFVLATDSVFGIYRNLLRKDKLTLHELAGRIKAYLPIMPTEAELGFALLRLYQEGLIGMTNKENFNTNQVFIRLKNLYAGSSKKVYLPEFKHGPEEDAGADVRAIDDVWLPHGKTTKIPLGFSAEIPKGYEIQVRSRSGLSSIGIVVANSPGTVDSGYRGEMAVLLYNGCGVNKKIKAGERIAQFVLNKVPVAKYEWSNKLAESKRGDGGFGSTGLK